MTEGKLDNKRKIEVKWLTRARNCMLRANDKQKNIKGNETKCKLNTLLGLVVHIFFFQFYPNYLKKNPTTSRIVV